MDLGRAGPLHMSEGDLVFQQCTSRDTLVSPMRELFALGATGWGDELLYGLVTTVQVSIFSFVFGVMAGLIGAMMKLSRSRIAYLFAHAYSVVFRAVPELLIISVLYFGGSIA